ncbi:hypothetical protein HK099_003271 [Clydaea vesicula]|uniref:Inhibitor of apoptosis repeat-containing protein n=1 Tax=Clydaea vesicula TaxID=447962 RepID=A0AAD5XWC1_9FUNG|nr:hypothetical protein HK099_003271 [Clydaea vesicula]
MTRLAHAGFYHNPTTQQKDRCTCFLCGCSIKQIDTSEDPISLHATVNSSCPLVIVHESSTGNLMGEETIWSSFINGARKKTFGEWWPKVGKKWELCAVEKMAQAGFSYNADTSSLDNVVCKYCSLELDGWEVGDDPKTEHLNRKPNCPFLNPPTKIAAKTTRENVIVEEKKGKRTRSQLSPKKPKENSKKKYLKVRKCTEENIPSNSDEENKFSENVRKKGLEKKKMSKEIDFDFGREKEKETIRDELSISERKIDINTPDDGDHMDETTSSKIVEENSDASACTSAIKRVRPTRKKKEVDNRSDEVPKKKGRKKKVNLEDSIDVNSNVSNFSNSLNSTICSRIDISDESNTENSLALSESSILSTASARECRLRSRAEKRDANAAAVLKTRKKGVKKMLEDNYSEDEISRSVIDESINKLAKFFESNDESTKYEKVTFLNDLNLRNDENAIPITLSEKENDEKEDSMNNKTVIVDSESAVGVDTEIVRFSKFEESIIENSHVIELSDKEDSTVMISKKRTADVTASSATLKNSPKQKKKKLNITAGELGSKTLQNERPSDLTCGKKENIEDSCEIETFTTKKVEISNFGRNDTEKFVKVPSAQIENFEDIIFDLFTLHKNKNIEEIKGKEDAFNKYLNIEDINLQKVLLNSNFTIKDLLIYALNDIVKKNLKAREVEMCKFLNDKVEFELGRIKQMIGKVA